jgi:hypothetical protein
MSKSILVRFHSTEPKTNSQIIKIIKKIWPQLKNHHNFEIMHSHPIVKKYATVHVWFNNKVYHRTLIRPQYQNHKIK